MTRSSKTPAANRYGLTERKKAELDQLSLRLLHARHEVDQYEAVVNALTQKLNNFQGFLAAADANRATCLENKNRKEQLVQSASDLLSNSNIALNEAALANEKTASLAAKMKMLIDKLIYATEIINKLSNLVISKKALNPLISDELITMIGAAGNDANNAVALTLTALQSCFTAQASNAEAEAITTLGYTQAMKLYDAITGSPVADPAVHSLSRLLDDAYENAKLSYNNMVTANNTIRQQLNHTTGLLNKAQVNLKSLQSGLAAANAAALA